MGGVTDKRPWSKGPTIVDLWRADSAGMTEEEGDGLWTYWGLSRQYAEWCRDEHRFPSTMSVYRAVVLIDPAEVLDLGDLGPDEDHDSIRYDFDADDGNGPPSHPRLLDAEAAGFTWVYWRCHCSNCQRPFHADGELLHIGANPIPMVETRR
jgi:hypothetical protein